mmetsp:Transcript_36001/g.116266  ORF Transcript_36001/g.116266 Transcript_36001/m.116266 type:complete len:200 (-) Transcript_36001:14-613(-)
MGEWRTVCERLSLPRRRRQGARRLLRGGGGLAADPNRRVARGVVRGRSVGRRGGDRRGRRRPSAAVRSAGAAGGGGRSRVGDRGGGKGGGGGERPRRGAARADGGDAQGRRFRGCLCRLHFRRDFGCGRGAVPRPRPQPRRPHRTAAAAVLARANGVRGGCVRAPVLVICKVPPCTRWHSERPRFSSSNDSGGNGSVCE